MSKQKTQLVKELLQIQAIKGANRNNYKLIIKDNKLNKIIDTIVNIDSIGSIEKYCNDNGIDYNNYYNGNCVINNGRTQKLLDSCKRYDNTCCGFKDYKNLMGWSIDYCGDWVGKIEPLRDEDNKILDTYYKIKTIISPIDKTL